MKKAIAFTSIALATVLIWGLVFFGIFISIFGRPVSKEKVALFKNTMTSYAAENKYDIEIEYADLSENGSSENLSENNIYFRDRLENTYALYGTIYLNSKSKSKNKDRINFLLRENGTYKIFIYGSKDELVKDYSYEFVNAINIFSSYEITKADLINAVIESQITNDDEYYYYDDNYYYPSGVGDFVSIEFCFSDYCETPYVNIHNKMK